MEAVQGSVLLAVYLEVRILSFQWLSVPFAWMHPAVSRVEVSSAKWMGTLEPGDIGSWIDYALLLVFGGIPWQVRL